MPGRPRRTCADDGPADKVVIHLHLFIPAGRARRRENKGRLRRSFAATWVGAGEAGDLRGVIQRGYILAEFDRTDLRPTRKATRTGGIYDAWPDYNGSASRRLGMGYHRVVAYLLTRADVDGSTCDHRHSRGASASCSRARSMIGLRWFAPMTRAAAGAGVTVSGPKSETIDMITKNFPVLV